MKNHAGESISVWMATAKLPSFSRLLTNEQADVCIVGAGIAGLTTAYLLGRAGKSVIVLDDGPIVSGETERTTAHLVTALDDRYIDLERLHGEKGARLAAESHSEAINQIERIVREEHLIVILSLWMDTFSWRRENRPTSSIEKWPLRSMPA